MVFNTISEGIGNLFKASESDFTKSGSSIVELLRGNLGLTDSAVSAIPLLINQNIGGMIDNVKERIGQIAVGGFGILTPLLDILKSWSSEFFNFIVKYLIEKFLPMKLELEKLTPMTIPSSSAITFDNYLKWINDLTHTVLGVKPFNIILGENDWFDPEQVDIYHVIMRLFVFIILGSILSLQGITAFFTPLIQQRVSEYYKFNRLELVDYIYLWRRGIVNDTELESTAEFLGYNPVALENAKRNDEKFLALENYIDLFRKNYINKEQLDIYAYQLGFMENEAENVLNLTKYFPAPNDLIDFAVKEAFESDEKLFIHGANAIPKPFIDYGTKLGIEYDWIKRYWHSHWRLLAPTQILDAFHRKLITESELLEYLRRLDYTESDRNLIMKMSYNLLTRVDVRRIFENGLMSSSELFNYYSTLGFSEKDSTLMTLLAKQIRFIETADLRKLYIEQFENGFLTVSEIRGLLSDTGLDSDEISLFLDYSNKSSELEFVKSLKGEITKQFYEGNIDYSELVSRLRKLGVSNRELERIERHASIYEFKKEKLPSITEIKRWVSKGIIDTPKFIYYALKMNYDPETIYYILRDEGLV